MQVAPGDRDCEMVIIKAVKERKLGQLANEPLKNYLSFISTVTK